MSDYAVSQVYLSDKRSLAGVDALLHREGITRDGNLDYICAMRDENDEIIATGENLGQVASQTMEAMTVTGAVVDIPIFMPLVGMDKKDIIAIAEKIGTLETSIVPYEDCCTVFTPKHPKTKPTLGQVLHAEEKLDREALIVKALESVEKIKVSYHDEPLL